MDATKKIRAGCLEVTICNLKSRDSSIIFGLGRGVDKINVAIFLQV